MKQNSQKIAAGLTIHYAAAFAIYFGAFCMVRSFISVYLLDRGFSYSQVGIIAGIHMFFSAIIQPMFSQILNRLPKLRLRQFLALCCVPVMLCSLLTFVLPTRMIFFIPLYIIFGMFEIGLQSLMVSVGMEYVNAGIPINAGLGRGMGSVGYALFNVLLGALIVRFGSSVSQILNIILLAVLCVLLLTLPDSETIGRTDRDTDSRSSEPSHDIIPFFRENSIYALFTLSVIFIFFGHSIVNTYMPDIAAQFGLDSDFTGLMNGLAAVLELIPMMFYARISKKISPMSMLRFSAVFFLIKILITTLARSGTGIAVGQVMQIFAYATYAMSSIFFTNQAVQPRDRILAQGLLVGAGELGFMIGGLVGGLVLDTHTIRTLLWIGVGATATGSMLMINAVQRWTGNSGNHK